MVKQSTSSSNTPSFNVNELQKKFGFSENSVVNPQTAHELFLRLGFLDLADCEWRAAAPGLKPLCLPRARFAVSNLISSTEYVREYFPFLFSANSDRRTATLSQELAQARERGKGHVTGRCEGTSKRHRVNATLSRQLLYPCEQKRARKPKIVERFGGKSGVTVDSDKTESRFRLFTSSSIFHKTWSRQESFFIEAKIQSMAPGLFSWR